MLYVSIYISGIIILKPNRLLRIIQESREEINSIGGVSLIGGIFNCLKKILMEIISPLDIDVSSLDNSGSSKESVFWTYKNHDGYAPIFLKLKISRRRGTKTILV